MDYIEIEIDSTLSALSNTSASSLDTPLVNIGRNLTNVVGAKILEVNIPFSYYTINNTPTPRTLRQQNSFSVAWKIGFVNSQFSITIPPGNYTSTQLATEIQTQLVAQTALPPLVGGSGTCTFNSNTGKFVIQITQAAPGPVTALKIVFSEFVPPFGPIVLFGDTIPLQPLASLLGFTSNVPDAVVTGGGLAFTWDPPSVANLTGPNNLYVNSVLLGNLCKAYLPESSLVTGETNPQMAMVPVNVNPGGIIWWQDPAPHEVFDTKNLFSLTRIDLYITAGTNPTPLLFNGLGFQVKLLLYVKFPDQGFSQSGTIAQNRAVMQIRPT